MKNNCGRSFVTIMIIIAVSALSLRVLIDRLIKINIAQNESQASVTLKSIAVALENYADDHEGIYPLSLPALTESTPPYLDKDYATITQSPVKGYNYTCSRLDEAGYSCSGTPLRCNLTGTIAYTITTGGLLMQEECGRKE